MVANTAGRPFFSQYYYFPAQQQQYTSPRTFQPPPHPFTFTGGNALLLRYTYAAFCGLVPLPLILFLANTKRSPLLPADKFLPKSRGDRDGSGSSVLQRYSSTASTASLSSTASARSGKDNGSSHEGDKRGSAKIFATKNDKLKPEAATARSLPVRVEIP